MIDNINLLIEQARSDYDSYLVLMDLAEETGILYFKRKKKSGKYLSPSLSGIDSESTSLTTSKNTYQSASQVLYRSIKFWSNSGINNYLLSNLDGVKI